MQDNCFKRTPGTQGVMIGFCYMISMLLLMTQSHKAESAEAYSRSASSLELPEISVIVNGQIDFSDSENENDEKLRINEAEIAINGYLTPGIRGDFIAALEQEYIGNEVETEADLEEAYLSFLDLPGGLQATLGRKFLGIGRLNGVHSHHWPFANTPLVLENLFGSHAWFDDGLEISYLLPNPWDIYLKVSAGVWNGRELGHNHSDVEESAHEESAHEEDGHEEDGHEEDGHEEDGHEEDGHEEDGHDGAGRVIEWNGHVYTGRIFADIPLSDKMNIQAGFSAAVDSEEFNTLKAADLLFKYQWPSTYKKFTWHTEWFFLENDTWQTSPSGYVTCVQFAPDKNWEIGCRRDFTELMQNDSENQEGWTIFVSYFFTHTTYLRAQYEKRENQGESENVLLLQFVWGVGPHSHRLKD